MRQTGETRSESSSLPGSIAPLPFCRMRSYFVLLFVSLLTSCEAQGTFGTPVFVLKGRDLLLKLHAVPPEWVLFVDWKLNKTVPLVRFDPSGTPTVHHNVAGGFEFPEIKFSVILKNLQEADSGVYSAVAATPTGYKPVAEYKVTVQGPVSPVELTVGRVDSSSSESCDRHVTCRTHNSHISSTFKCPKGVCSQEGGERSEVTTSGASLQVYLLNNVIICNHSNQVNWTQDLITAEDLCFSKPDPPLHYGWVISICILTLIMIVVLFVWLRRRIIRSTQKSVYYEETALKVLSLLNKRAASTPQDDAFFKDFGRAVYKHFLRLLNKVASTAPRQDGTPADCFSGLKKRQDDLKVEMSLLSAGTARHQDGTPADPDPDAFFKDFGRAVYKALTLVPQIKDPTPPQDGLEKSQEDALKEVMSLLQSAASTQHQDGLTKSQEDALKTMMNLLIKRAASAPPLDGSSQCNDAVEKAPNVEMNAAVLPELCNLQDLQKLLNLRKLELQELQELLQLLWTMDPIEKEDLRQMLRKLQILEKPQQLADIEQQLQQLLRDNQELLQQLEQRVLQDKSNQQELFFDYSEPSVQALRLLVGVRGRLSKQEDQKAQ